MVDQNLVTPINKNFLQSLEFKMILKRAPHVNFFVQRANIPQINMTPAIVPTGLLQVPHPGDQIVYSPFVVEFKVDEDFKNYMEIHNWLRGLGHPDELEQYGELKNNPVYTGEAVYSDVSLMVMNSTKYANYEIVFRDAFPTSLSDLVFSTTATDVDYLEAMVTFAYTSYKMERV